MEIIINMEAVNFELEFGTGGLRAVMGPGGDRMNDMTVGMATQGLANYIRKYTKGAPASVVISYDCRNHSEEFARIAAKVLSYNGIDVFIFDRLRPTPEMSYAIRLKGAVAGIMITASHNPPEYNGYKVSWQDGGQITSPVDKDIVAEVGRIKDTSEVLFEGVPEIVPGKITEMGLAEDECYFRDILSLTLSPESVARHNDMKIVYTPLHGCGVRLVPECLSRMGLKNVFHVPEQDVNDGDFPTVESPNPEEEGAWTMAFAVAGKEHADIVLATDPDADRMGLAARDDDGRMVRFSGNETAAMLTYYILSRRKELGTLGPDGFVVKTIVTSRMVDAVAADFGVACHNVLTGWKYIAEQVKLHENDGEFLCGCEESLGFNAGTYVRDKDAQLACAMVVDCAAWAADKGMTLWQLLQFLYARYGRRTDERFSLVRKGKDGAAEIAAIIAGYRSCPPKEIAGSPVTRAVDYLDSRKTGLPESNVLQFFNAEGDVVSIRPSGTEPKIRFYFSVTGEDAPSKIESLKNQFL